MDSKKLINYQALFFMGVSFIGLGVVFMAAVNVVLGISFIVIGIANMIIGRRHKQPYIKSK